MILTIAGANFSGANIGTNTNVGITLTKGNGVSGSKVSSLTLEKNQVVSTATKIADLSLQTGYENLVVTVTMTGTGDVSSWFSNGTVTIPSGTTITGNIKITASATKTATGEDEPVTPTMYTLTINPTPTTATVTLTASGYSQSGNSITVPANTSVAWRVSASGYTEQNGTHTVTKTESKSVTLSAVSGGGESGESIDLSTLSLNHCGSSKLSESSSNENLAYNNETHELSINETGWYKISYFEQPVQVGMEIEIETYFSKSISGNFMGIFESEDLVDGISETSTNPASFWPAPSIFGVYAPGTPANGEMIYKWCKNNGKIKTADSLTGDAMNNKTVKLKLYESGVKCYIDDVELSWATGSVENPMETGTNYYFGCHNNASGGTPVVSKINYIGPIR